MEMTNHFGINLRRKEGGHLLTRENYCKINSKSSLRRGKIYSEEWCKKHFSNCMKNFDLNMQYFSCLDVDKFDEAISDFLEKYSFEEVENVASDYPFRKNIKNLNCYNGVSGYYLMVLDNYKQAYIGTSNNIRKRIINHWSKTKQFDRLLLPIGNINSSIISIDSFRALDTTRIWVSCDELTFYKENRYINSFNARFLSNRIGGGLMSDGGLLGFIEAVSTMKTRKLNN